jgi:hypothetical protein
MKKPEQPADELRAEYGRQDLGPLLRGKYAARVARSSNVVVIDQALTKAFPNSDAVNEALRGLLNLATSAVRKQTPAKKATTNKARA